MSLAIELAIGGEGEAHAFDGEVLHVIVGRAFAPGAPVELAVHATPTLMVRGKALGSKRQEDGRFAVRLRLVTLKRDDREQLLSRLSE